MRQAAHAEQLAEAAAKAKAEAETAIARAKAKVAAEASENERQLRAERAAAVDASFAEREAALAQRERDVDGMLAAVVAGGRGGASAAAQIQSLSQRLSTAQGELQRLLDESDARCNKLEASFEAELAEARQQRSEGVAEALRIAQEELELALEEHKIQNRVALDAAVGGARGGCRRRRCRLTPRRQAAARATAEAERDRLAMRLEASEGELYRSQLAQHPGEQAEALTARVRQLESELQQQRELAEARLEAQRDECRRATAAASLATQQLQAAEEEQAAQAETAEAQMAEMEQVVEDLHTALMDAMSAKGDLLCLQASGGLGDKLLQQATGAPDAYLQRLREVIDRPPDEAVAALRRELSEVRPGDRELELEAELEALRRLVAADEASQAEAASELESARGDSARLARELAAALEHVRRVEQVRRRLHCELQDVRGSVRVYCRVRPPLAAEGDPEHISYPDPFAMDRIVVADNGAANVRGEAAPRATEFGFNRIFGPGATQAEVFAEFAGLTESVLDGFSVCIFACAPLLRAWPRLR